MLTIVHQSHLKVPILLQKLPKAKEAAQTEPNIKNTVEYHELVEEEMIRGLQRQPEAARNYMSHCQLIAMELY
ncbi:Tropomyosin [Bienertia sinuspersici]